jgi:hypothetical protein
VVGRIFKYNEPISINRVERELETAGMHARRIFKIKYNSTEEKELQKKDKIKKLE